MDARPHRAQLFSFEEQDPCEELGFRCQSSCLRDEPHSQPTLHPPDRKQTVRPLYVLDEATGEMLAKAIVNSPVFQFYPTEDRLLTIRDASHSETELAFFRVRFEQFEQLAEFWQPPHQNTTAYEVYMEHPYARGRIYLRTKDGRIACYDLRKQ